MKLAEHFDFGQNWRKFLSVVGEDQIKSAEQSLKELLDADHLHGIRFLDVGSGSGLLSLAARRLGAAVHSFDMNPESVRCTEELKQRYYPEDGHWSIESGDVLDKSYLQALGKFDVVYSWGVLHHTGAMWHGLENVGMLVDFGGQLCIAIYNDQGWISSYWKVVKKLYNRNRPLQFMITIFHVPYLLIRLFVRMFKRHGVLERGMSLWYDMTDWLGGYPFEVAMPEKICEFFKKKGFIPGKKKTCGRRHGCNEFVFVKKKIGKPVRLYSNATIPVDVVEKNSPMISSKPSYFN